MARALAEALHRGLVRWRLAGGRHPWLRRLGARRHLDPDRDPSGQTMLRNVLMRYVIPGLVGDSKSSTPPAGIVIVCGTLGSGGAERQIVNTALGLRSRGCTAITIL